MIISFGQLSLKILYPFITAITYILKNYTYYEIKMADFDKKWYSNPFFFNLLFFIGTAANGILYLISFFINKPNKHNTQKLLTPLTIQHFTSISVKSEFQLQVLWFFITGLLSVITVCVINIMSSIYDTKSDLQYEARIFNLFFVAVLSYFILKYRIGAHHLFSFACVGIGIILCFFSKYFYEDSNEGMMILIHLANYFVFSIRDVFDKWMMEIKQQGPLKLVFYQGIFATIIQLGALYIYNAIFPDSTLALDTLFSYMFTDGKMSLLFIGHFLSCIGYSLFSTYTKFHFSPTAMPIVFSFAMIPWKIIFITSMESSSQKILVIIGYILVLFGCLIYNEIIIIHFCNLDNYTRSAVADRGSFELKENSNLSLLMEEERRVESLE